MEETQDKNNYQGRATLTEEQNLKNLNLILEELAELDSSKKSDQELLKYIEDREVPKYIPFPLIKVKFGKIVEAETRNHYKTKKIEVYYNNKKVFKNITDFLYTNQINEIIRCKSQIINPKYFNYETYLKFFHGNLYPNAIQLLENKTFLLFRSFWGNNKFGKKLNSWDLVSLGENEKNYPPIYREYMMRSYRDGLKWLSNPYYNFLFRIPILTNENICREIIYPIRDNFNKNYIEERKKDIIKEKGNPYKLSFLP